MDQINNNDVIKEISKPVRNYVDMVFNNPQGVLVGFLEIILTVIVGTFIFRTINGWIDKAIQSVGVPLDEPLISYDTYFQAIVINGQIAEITSKAKGIITHEGSSEIILKKKGIYIISATAQNEPSQSIAISHPTNGRNREELIGGRTIIHWTKEENEVIELKPDQNAIFKVFYMGLNKNNDKNNKNNGVGTKHPLSFIGFN